MVEENSHTRHTHSQTCLDVCDCFILLGCLLAGEARCSAPVASQGAPGQPGRVDSLHKRLPKKKQLNKMIESTAINNSCMPPHPLAAAPADLLAAMCPSLLRVHTMSQHGAGCGSLPMIAHTHTCMCPPTSAPLPNSTQHLTQGNCLRQQYRRRCWARTLPAGHTASHACIASSDSG